MTSFWNKQSIPIDLDKFVIFEVIKIIVNSEEKYAYIFRCQTQTNCIN